MGEGEEESEAQRKRGRLWKIDPGMYESRPRPQGIGSRLSERVKSVGTLLIVILLFFYPVFLIYMGLVYGWIGFWGSFVGSAVLIGLGIRQAGYSGNFESWGRGNFFRQLVMLVVGFGAAIAFFEGLFMARVWLLPGILFVLLLILSYRLLRG